MASSPLVQGFDECLAVLGKSNKEIENIPEAEKVQFFKGLSLYHQGRVAGRSLSSPAASPLPQPPSFGERKVDLLSYFRIVREHYGSYSGIDSEDLLSIARSLRIKYSSIPNGLQTLRAIYENYLLPLELDIARGGPPQPPPPPPPLPSQFFHASSSSSSSLGPHYSTMPSIHHSPVQHISSQSPPSSSSADVNYAPEIHCNQSVVPCNPSQTTVPAQLPHSALDLHRIAIGIQQGQVYALRVFDGWLALLSEGKILPGREDEFVVCINAVIGLLIENIDRVCNGEDEKAELGLIPTSSSQGQIILLNHLLHSFFLFLQVRKPQFYFRNHAELLDSLLNVFCSFNESLVPKSSRVLAGRILLMYPVSDGGQDEDMLVEGALSCFLLATNDKTTRLVSIHILTRFVHVISRDILASEVLPGLRRVLLENIPIRDSTKGCCVSPLVSSSLGFLHLLLESRSTDLVQIRKCNTTTSSSSNAMFSFFLEYLIVDPLISLLPFLITGSSDDEDLVSALSCILKIGVQPDLRKILNPYIDSLTSIALSVMVSTGNSSPMVQSLWNVITEMHSN